jgi:hypothetical protein
LERKDAMATLHVRSEPDPLSAKALAVAGLVRRTPPAALQSS